MKLEQIFRPRSVTATAVLIFFFLASDLKSTVIRLEGNNWARIKKKRARHLLKSNLVRNLLFEGTEGVEGEKGRILQRQLKN